MRASLLNLFAVAGLVTSVVATVAVPDTHAVHEKRDVSSPLSSRWTKRSRVEQHRKLPVRIGLAQSNLDEAHEHLMRISDPASPHFGQHWTSDEVIDFFQPSDEAVDAVTQWLSEHGVTHVTHSDNKAWLAFDAPASTVEALLHTEYYEHHDSLTGGVMPACDEYHVPKEIQHHIDYITPGIKLMAPMKAEAQGKMKRKLKRSAPKTHQSSPIQKVPRSPKLPGMLKEATASQVAATYQNLSSCDTVITPACVAALYQIPPGNKSDPSNTLGIFEAELQWYDQYDLDLFYKRFTPWIPAGNHPININIDGGVAETDNVSIAGPEVMLDIELAYPIVWPQNVTIFNVDDIPYQTWANDSYTWGYNTLLDAIDGSYCTYTAYNETGDEPGIDPTYPDPMPGGYNGTLQCGVFEPTNVISFSYGGPEASVPIAYQKRQCNEYLKLGLQGITFVFASGDSGVANEDGLYSSSTCLGPEGTIFSPDWPGNCPYVTAVGGTTIPEGSTVSDPESAVFEGSGDPATSYTSGGGFSNVYTAPDYQKSAVAKFFADHDPGYAYYSGVVEDAPNPALPNVTALAGDTGGRYNRVGRGYPDVSANGLNIAMYYEGSFTTAGGTSASAPIFSSVINRINEERIAIGKGPVGFINPTLYAHPEVLNDVYNGSNLGCIDGGFAAVDGWDPVTGLGTPNYPKMLELFLSLP